MLKNDNQKKSTDAPALSTISEMLIKHEHAEKNKNDLKKFLFTS